MRVSVFVDGNNFYHMQKNALGWVVDLVKLLDYLEGFGEIVDAFYYSTVLPSQDNAFLKSLPNRGYALRSKPVRYNHSTGKVYKGNMDVEMAIDLFNLVNTYDMAVLITGDSDFEYALQILRNRGKLFKVLSTEGTISPEIKEISGMHYIDFREIRAEVEYQPESTQPSQN